MVAQSERLDEVQAITRSMTQVLERLRRGLERATFAQRRQLVELLIDRVIVTNGEVEIRYVIPTSEASTHTRFCQLRMDYFHAIPLAVRTSVEARVRTLVTARGDHCPDAAPTQVGPHRLVAEALVAGDPARAQPRSATSPARNRALIQHGFERDLLVALAAGQHRGDRLPMAFGAQVELGRETTLRAAQSLLTP